jgi:predicted alpha/beta superfamily hydrolase
MSRDRRHDAERKATDRSSESTIPAPAAPRLRIWQDYPGDDDGAEHTVVGNVKVLAGVDSPQLGNRRDLFVYLPPSYAAGSRHYPVVYMHDGQNLFDRATSFGDEWEVDQTMEAASHDGLEAIVVAIPNMGRERLDEYSPFADSKRGGGRGDLYLDFLVDTVKPIVDADFRTLPERASTGIAGSSMGGLISLYAFFRRPDIFGFAGVMSPALWFGDRAIFDFIEAAPFVEGRLYLDVGTREGAIELVDVARLRDLLRRKGYRPGRNFLSVVERGAGHTERAWAGRLRRELDFLLGRGDAPTGRPAGDTHRTGTRRPP